MHLSPPPRCDYLLFTSVSAESRALREVAAEMGLSCRRGKSNLGDFIDLGTVGTSRALAIRTQMGPFSSAGSAAKALQWVGATRAKAIIGCGMGFGALPGRQKHGDVLVATALFPYDYRIVKRGPADVPVADYSEVPTHPACPALLSLFDRAARTPRWLGRVHLGPFLSGAARIRCSAYRDELLGAFRDRGLVVGGDMEGIGLLAASDDTGPRWAIVKGISDFADEARDDVIERTRSGACYNAILFVLTALKDEEALRPGRPFGLFHERGSRAACGGQ